MVSQSCDGYSRRTSSVYGLREMNGIAQKFSVRDTTTGSVSE